MRILYEDSALLFVDKAGDVVVQRGYDAEEPVLFEEVTRYLSEKGESAFLMQRLDRGTSGVIFFTKLSKINANLTRQFERKAITKTYLALCEGRLLAQTVDAPLARVGPISFGVRTQGKRAITTIEPLDRGPDSTLARIHLLTGRTHQIRVHCAAIGHPLIGDWLYGKRNAVRPMLHALSLFMRHPLTNEPLTVTAPPPADFLKEMAQRQIGPGLYDHLTVSS